MPERTLARPKAEQLSNGDPRSSHRFIEVSLPDRFILEAPSGDGWIEHGRYDADAFQRQPDGSYLCAGHGGSPTYLRCLREKGAEIDVAGGDGRQTTFRVIALPDPAYPA